MSGVVRQGSETAFTFNGLAVRCPVCDGGRFWSRWTQLMMGGTWLMGAALPDQPAYVLVCGDCTHVLWFLDPDRLESSG